MATAKFLFVWIRRLPAWFTTCFLILMIAQLYVLTYVLNPSDLETISDFGSKWISLPAFLRNRPTIHVGLEGAVFLLLILIATLISYNAAVLVCRLTPRRKAWIFVSPPVHPHPGKGSRVKKFNRIGIILAGGGAKGAYQAGAMKAIYEFLEENNALEKVKMIAGTSIGSWNSLFWLADLIKSRNGAESVHERWWKSISIPRLVEFDYYLPLRMNHFLRTTPWQEGFQEIFAQEIHVHKYLARLLPDGNQVHKDFDPPIHFYLTRSNVASGRLEFATNWPGIATRTRPALNHPNHPEEKPVVDADRYEIIQGESSAALAKLQRAVFASMDLPPLFPYIPVKVDRTAWFEDGGVVDNLPVWFGTQIEECDLLFILPLNASFAEPVNHTSVTHRLFRVMDVRQGVLERNSLKLAYLYNELAAARQGMAGGNGHHRASEQLEQRVRDRKNDPVSVFAICPNQPLQIGTAELWKTREAGAAFDLMYAETKAELDKNFEDLADPNWIRMVLISPEGERAYVDNF